MHFTQRSFAKTVSFTASRNCSTVGAAMHILSAPYLIRNAFSSGRNSTILPSCVLYAFKPSNSPWTHIVLRRKIHNYKVPECSIIKAITTIFWQDMRYTNQRTEKQTTPTGKRANILKRTLLSTQQVSSYS